jgi:hypothetical protein
MSPDRGTRGRALALVGPAVVGMLLLGVVVGWLWDALARPAQWQVTERGILLTEEASGRQVGVELLFVALGAAASLLAGLVVGHLLRRLGWGVVPLVVAGTGAASVVAWRVGLWLGPGDPAATPDPQVGQRIPAQLAVESLASFVVWPIAGLVGVLVVTWLVGRPRRFSEPGEPAPRP